MLLNAMLNGFGRSITFTLAITVAGSLAAADRTKEGDWIHERDEKSGRLILIRELTLQPAPEAKPALKYQLIPSDFQRVEGNAAIHYLKAMGFLEQQPARRRVDEFVTQQQERARLEGRGSHEVPPYNWLSSAPEDLPVEEVREYLSWLSFQLPFIDEAVRRRNFDMDRRIQDVDDPIMYLLPEIQHMRELARTHSMRFRLAIAEDRVDDAIELLGEQYAMANHLGQDIFLVSNLVGTALGGIAFGDALYLPQHKAAPNLYWAYASLPDPLVDMGTAYGFEREFLFEQLKALRDVDETPRPAGYWAALIDRLIPQARSLLDDSGIGTGGLSPEAQKATFVAAIAAAYPGAKQYLLDETDIDDETIESYPTAQVVFLAVKRFHERAADDFFKWNHVPFWQAERAEAFRHAEDEMHRAVSRLGWAAVPTSTFLPALRAAKSAQERSRQLIALLQTVESIRAYAAEHNGELPSSLDSLSLPAPVDPITGDLLPYELEGDQATLSGAPLPGVQYRLVLRVADPK